MSELDIKKIYANGKDEVEFFKQLEKRNGETSKEIKGEVCTYENSAR